MRTEEATYVIKSVLKDAYAIERPNVPGSLKSVFFAKTPNGTFVCKFNHPAMAIKNAEISKIMSSHGINVPQITIYNYGTHWLETYPIISGKTLYEHIGDGLGEEKQKCAYKAIVDAFIKMDAIGIGELKSSKYKYTHRVAKTNISDTNNTFIASLFSGAVYLANLGTKKSIGLYHCGVTTKNTILDDDGNFSSLIDLDEAAIANRNYAFGMMAAKYQQLGYDIMDLIQYYEAQTGNKLNHKKIKLIAKLTNIGKHFLWKRNVKKKVH